MDPTRYERLTDLFLRALELEEGDAREAFLARECGADGELGDRLRAMIATSSSNRLEQAAARVTEFLAEEPWDDGTSPRVEGFRVGRRLGEGGMGVVFEAEQESVHRSVALKLVRPGTETEEVARRFELEGELLGRLEHPGIARIYEMGCAASSWGNVRYFAMELVDGMPLRDRALDLDTRAKVALVASLCDAVEHAHGKGVLHRDLKPANVLVRRNGDPVVLDFGVGRLAETADSDLTRSGIVIGTPAYMSPEQLSGDATRVDARSDVYAIGVIGFELLAGRLPYDVAGAGLVETARAIAEDDPPRLGRFDPDLRGDLETIFAKVLAKEPDRRYASASALAADLRRYLAHEPVLARPATTLYQLTKFARRNRWLVTGLVSTGAALAAGLIVAVYLAAEARERSRAAETALARADTVRDLFVETFRRADPYRAHGAALTVVDALASASAELGTLNDEPEIEAALRALLAELLLDRERPDLALENARRAAEHYSALHGPADAEALDARTLEARALTYLGRHEEALAIHAAVRRERADEAARWADAYHEVFALQELGRYDEALPLAERAVRELTRVVGPEAADTLWARFNHVRTLLVSGRPVEAASLGEPLLDEIRERFGEEARLTLQVLDVAGAALSEAGALRQALDLRDEAIARRAAVLGDDHADVLHLRVQRAITLKRLGQIDEALETLERERDAYERIYGPAHPDTLKLRANLLGVYEALGRHDDVLREADELEELARSAFPPDHFYNGWLDLLRAEAWLQLGDPAEAIPILLAAHEHLEAAFDAEHEWVGIAAGHLAAAYEELGEESRAAMWRSRAPAARQ